jgi:hypothetical protein
MHDGPQVQDDGREDATFERDSRTKIVDCDERPEISYWCNRCDTHVGPRKKQPHLYLAHELHVLRCWPDGKIGVDYVECALCKFAGSKITQHVNSQHQLSKEKYFELYGPAICDVSSKKYSATDNCNWIERRKKEGFDPTEYRQKMSDSVSRAILSSPEERDRRSVMLGSLNKRKDFRDRSSAVARITSSRPEIIAKRTENLNNWRINNPELFQEMASKFIGRGSSRPENILLNMCKEIWGSEVTSQFQIKHPSIPNKSHRARVDIANKSKHILIEFDGPFHFFPILGIELLDQQIKRDLAVENYAMENGYLLIRISEDMFNGKSFQSDVINLLKECDSKFGIIRLGKAYSENLYASMV